MTGLWQWALRQMRKMDRSSFQPIRQGDSVEEAARRMMEAILSGQLQPGQPSGEADLARRFGVSRAPVREAARQLQQRGLLVAEPRRGFFVRSLTVQEVMKSMACACAWKADG